MNRWTKGAADLDQLLEAGHLQRVRGTQADGTPWIERARRTLATARLASVDDPESGYTLAYDAARFACTGLLSQQGLRPTTAGGPYGVERTVRAQFGDAFKAFGGLRRRRNELEYPTHAEAAVGPDEVAVALAKVEEIIIAADRLLPHLGLF